MTKVKICGLQTLEDVHIVNRTLPDYAGFIFAPSRRQIDKATANQLRSAMDSRIRCIGVFVNQEPALIRSLYDAGIIQGVQLHGDESDEYVKQLKEETDATIIKSVSVGEKAPDALPQSADYLLFDTASAKEKGGTGITFDWRLLPPTDSAFFLAGGLNLDNVEKAIDQIHPYCIDVSSGVETDRKKDAQKVAQFIDIVRRNT